MKISRGLWVLVMLALTACGGGDHHITYSGHEESTDGVPGFVNGKRVSPHVKLGQSYTVDGEQFVPRYQPDYVEEGMASWYGPGFHGGKTANGEEFDKNDMTAAHRTLPLPSIVKVTMLSTGRWAYVRINDRGPFAKGRIIDLSRGAAEAIGLIAKGTAKVRVEYMPSESQRFTDLLAEGRDPKSIDLAEEVIGKGPQYASNAPSSGKTSKWWNAANPVASAEAAETAPERPVEFDSAPADVEPREVSQATEDSAPLTTIASNDLPPVGGKPVASASPFSVMEPAKPAMSPAPAPMQVASASPAPANAAPAIAGDDKRYIQLGAFLNSSNAEKMRAQYSQYGTTAVLNKTANDGATMHYVRMGPFSVEQSAEKLAQLHGIGVDAKIVRE